MATFVSTIRFTEQGIKAIGETTKRAAAVKAAAKKMKVKVTDIYWTLGPFDGQSTTARAFTATEMDKVLAKMGG